MDFYDHAYSGQGCLTGGDVPAMAAAAGPGSSDAGAAYDSQYGDSDAAKGYDAMWMCKYAVRLN